MPVTLGDDVLIGLGVLSVLTAVGCFGICVAYACLKCCCEGSQQEARRRNTYIQINM